MLDSAVLGGAGADVGQLAQRVELQVRCTRMLTRLRSRRVASGVDGVAVDDQRDLAVGEHGAAGERRALGDARAAAGG